MSNRKCGNHSSCTSLLFFFIVLFLLLLGYILYIRIKEYYQQSDPMLHKIKELVLPLHPKINDILFFESDKSYTINKKRIYLCLKDSEHRYYSLNMLVYVAVHEISHVLCDEIGHTSKFYDIFRDLLKKAEEIGIYDSSIPITKNYCGHD